MFRASPSQMALTDTATGQYIEVNAAFLRSLGFAREEVIGKTALELNLFVNPAQRMELLQRMAVAGCLRDESVLVRTRSGEIRQGMFSAEFIHVSGQRLLLTVMNDVTEKMRAEERFARVFHVSPAAQMIVSVVDGTILDANALFASRPGLTSARSSAAQPRN